MRDLVHGAAQASDFRNIGADAPGHVHQHEWISVDIGLTRNLPRLLSGNAFGLRPRTRRRELKGDGAMIPATRAQVFVMSVSVPRGVRRSFGFDVAAKMMARLWSIPSQCTCRNGGGAHVPSATSGRGE